MGPNVETREPNKESAIDRAVRESIELVRANRTAQFESVVDGPLREVMEVIAAANASDLHAPRRR